MDDNEKAEEICRDYNYTQFLNDGTKDIYTESAVLYMLEEMAQWKEQQMIDKAVKWLALNAQLYDGFNPDCLENMVDKFKQAMKKE